MKQERIKLTPVSEITFVGVMSALCIASRVMLQFLPNIKPVTSIIIIMSILFGTRVGVEVAVVTTVLSGFLLGLGPWIPFQILAWGSIAFIAGVLGHFTISRNVFIMSWLSAISGFLFGVVVSLQMLVTAGIYGYITYWLAGLTFDLLHAAGNLAFYPLCWMMINKSLVFCSQSRKV